MKKLLKIVLIIIIIIIALFWISVVITAIFGKSDATTMDMSASINVNTCETPSKYYDNFEEAIQNKIKEIQIKNDGFKMKEELIHFEDNDSITSIFLSQYNNEKFIDIVGFDKKNGKVSNCIYYKIIYMENMITPHILKEHASYKYDEEIAMDLIFSLFDTGCTRANNDNPVVYGLTDNIDIYALTIKGEVPKKIIPIDNNGETYYFWYYDSIDFVSELTKNINLSAYQLGEIVDCLDIKVPKEEEQIKQTDINDEDVKRKTSKKKK